MYTREEKNIVDVTRQNFFFFFFGGGVGSYTSPNLLEGQVGVRFSSFLFHKSLLFNFFLTLVLINTVVCSVYVQEFCLFLTFTPHFESAAILQTVTISWINLISPSIHMLFFFSFFFFCLEESWCYIISSFLFHNSLLFHIFNLGLD